MEHLGLVLTLTMALAAALVCGFVTHRIGLSPIVGYLVAGIAIGPFTPGLVARTDIAQQLAEVGVVLLMFGAGMQFHLHDLLAVWKVVVPGAILRTIATTAVVAGGAHLAGWNLSAGIVLGIALSISSTVVVFRILSDNDAIQTVSGRTLVGWLVVEDLVTVVVLVVMPIVASPTKSFVVPLAIALAKMGLMIALAMTIGARIIPRMLAWIARTHSRELFTLSVLVVALGIAVLAAELFGASMALGAFLAGLTVGRSEFATRAASEALPMRDAFAVLFFVSVGMLLDPRTLVGNAKAIAAALVVVLLVRAAIGFALARIARAPRDVALGVALGLVQIGEFSFIVATLGQQLGMISGSAMNVIVATSIVTITASPLAYRAIAPLSRTPPDRRVENVAGHAVVVGYGPVGRTAARLLAENNVDVVIVELNLDTVRALESEGRRAIYGDASRLDVLEGAGVARASSLIYAASGTPAEAIVRTAKTLNPDIRILARAAYLREVESARAAGADAVVVSEVEVALAMTEHLLAQLGATPEQLDRARDHARAELVVRA